MQQSKVSQAQMDVYGKMAYSERIGDSVAINIYGEQDLKLFESGVKYFLAISVALLKT